MAFPKNQVEASRLTSTDLAGSLEGIPYGASGDFHQLSFQPGVWACSYSRI